MINSRALFLSFILVSFILFSGCNENTVTQNTSPPSSNDQVNPAKSSSINQEKENSTPIPGQYIVVFESEWEGLVKNQKAREALDLVESRINKLGIAEDAVRHTYHHAMRGFTGKLFHPR